MPNSGPPRAPGVPMVRFNQNHPTIAGRYNVYAEIYKYGKLRAFESPWGTHGEINQSHIAVPGRLSSCISYIYEKKKKVSSKF